MYDIICIPIYVVPAYLLPVYALLFGIVGGIVTRMATLYYFSQDKVKSGVHRLSGATVIVDLLIYLVTMIASILLVLILNTGDVLGYLFVSIVFVPPAAALMVWISYHIWESKLFEYSDLIWPYWLSLSVTVAIGLNICFIWQFFSPIDII